MESYNNSGDPGEARAPPLFLDQTKNKFFGRLTPPPLSKGLDDPPPPRDTALHNIQLIVDFFFYK